MEQTSFTVLRGRHSGWSEEENKLLWETADEAQIKGLPLKQVFDYSSSFSRVKRYFIARLS